MDDNTQEACILHVLRVSSCLLWYLDNWIYIGLLFPHQCHHLLFAFHSGTKMKSYSTSAFTACVKSHFTAKKIGDSYILGSEGPLKFTHSLLELLGFSPQS